MHVYNPGTGVDNPFGSIFALTQLFSQFSPLLQVIPFNGFVTVLPIQM